MLIMRIGPSSKMWALAALAGAVVIGCGTPPEPEPAPPEVEQAREAPEWPAEGAPLTPPEVTVPEGFGVRRVFLDAGHGAAGNEGNVGALCQKEQEHTLLVARDLARRLEATGAFEVRISRPDDDARPGYRDRVAEAERWGADVLLSIHSDARHAATAEVHRAPEGFPCRTNEGEHGFSVLYADDGAPALVERRHRLATALATSLADAGFPPYQGTDYDGLYEVDAGRAGAWVDRHEPGKRIYMLRAPQMPSVIVETHQALDREEAVRWQEPRTHEAFGAAVAAGLLDALASPGE